MAFTQATAPTGLRNSEILSADNSIPERHIVVATLRNAAPRLGLSATVISTLDAMLSCLAPKRNHHTVFASNATLTFRRNGISDRTIRRHAATLQEIGLLVRRDSPNRKRFTKHNRHEGTALRFGFDLSPLFDRLHEIASMAAEVMKEREQIDYLRAKIRAAANASLTDNPNDEIALGIFRVLRRKLSLKDCEQILSNLPISVVDAESVDDENPISTTTMAANDGQFVRHHHKSNKEHINKESITQKRQNTPKASEAPITIPELLTACPEAAEFSLKKIVTVHDVVAHARTLAPMIGITAQNYEAAHKRLGALRAAATVWAIMQFHDKIKAVGAYFRSITTGSKSDGFSPEKLIRRLVLAQNHAA
ncbi:plasmid replication protein RepC [Sulfitobacter geojensis]|uniref:plasmid replication protein RepC n=1 Tax=Sulfitobacter geojensis TaxID=1342299 RepID=UPI00046896B5|nr:plasmid replication protein RepC [Sulfitobacter geojensis]KHA54278.1 Plasmid replication protein RepC [Sulfitobacter geojensis]NYI30177.1 replication initiation protein RepC [Sulfitobacter geojensis]